MKCNSFACAIVNTQLRITVWQDKDNIFVSTSTVQAWCVQLLASATGDHVRYRSPLRGTWRQAGQVLHWYGHGFRSPKYSRSEHLKNTDWYNFSTSAIWPKLSVQEASRTNNLKKKKKNSTYIQLIFKPTATCTIQYIQAYHCLRKQNIIITTIGKNQLEARMIYGTLNLNRKQF